MEATKGLTKEINDQIANIKFDIEVVYEGVKAEIHDVSKQAKEVTKLFIDVKHLYDGMYQGSQSLVRKRIMS